MDRLPFSPPNVWRAIQDAREAGTLGKPEGPEAGGLRRAAPPNRCRRTDDQEYRGLLGPVAVVVIFLAGTPSVVALRAPSRRPGGAAVGVRPRPRRVTSWDDADWDVFDEKVIAGAADARLGIACRWAS